MRADLTFKLLSAKVEMIQRARAPQGSDDHGQDVTRNPDGTITRRITSMEELYNTFGFGGAVR